MTNQKGSRRIKLERLAARARDAQACERRMANVRAAKLAHATTLGTSIALLAFANATSERAVTDAAAAVDAALAPIASTINTADWQDASSAIPALTDALKAFADTAGIPYESKDGSAAPAQLVAALEDARRRHRKAGLGGGDRSDGRHRGRAEQ